MTTEPTPKQIPTIQDNSSEDDYTDFLEWTPQEEEEFLRIFEIQENKLLDTDN